MTDLLKVKQAADAAHRNFVAAIELDHNVHNAALVEYLDGFLDETVARSPQIRQSARQSRERLLTFERTYTAIIENIGLLLMERDVLLGGATVHAADLLLKEFSDVLDNVDDHIKKMDRGEIPIEKAGRGEVEKLTRDVEALGNAVALVEQLGASLATTRLENLAGFSELVEGKSRLEAFKDFSGKDTADILLEFVLTYIGTLTNYTALVGAFKKSLDVLDRRRAPLVGHKTGDADALFQLDDLTGRDQEIAGHVASALAEARRHVAILRIRQAEIADGRRSA